MLIRIMFLRESRETVFLLLAGNARADASHINHPNGARSSNSLERSRAGLRSTETIYTEATLFVRVGPGYCRTLCINDDLAAAVSLRPRLSLRRIRTLSCAATARGRVIGIRIRQIIQRRRAVSPSVVSRGPTRRYRRSNLGSRATITELRATSTVPARERWRS